MRAASRLACSWARLCREKRCSSMSSRANAWISRTPDRSSCRVERVWPIRSRTIEVGAVRAAAEADARGQHDRHRDEADEGQTGRHADDHHDRAEQQQRVGDEHDEAELHELGERVDVGRHARDEPAGLLAAEEVERERLQMVEHAHAQIAQEALADARHQPDLHAAQHHGRERDAHEGERRQVERAPRRRGGGRGRCRSARARGPRATPRWRPPSRCSPATTQPR